MKPAFVGGASFRGCGVSLALGLGVPTPLLNETVLMRTCVRDRDILAPVVDCGSDYPQATGQTIGRVSYERLRTGRIEVEGRKITVGSLSSYHMALEIANLLADEVRRGEFTLTPPIVPLPVKQKIKPLVRARE